MIEKAVIVLRKGYAIAINYLEIIIPTLCVAQLLAGIVVYFTDADLFEWYIKEDGFAETLTVIFLVLTAIIASTKSITFKSRKKYFYIFIAVIFMFGAGEELSWGQRIFDFGTPETLKAINTQNDFTLHNIEVNDVKLNKLIFGTVMYLGVFAYFLLLPLLVNKNRKVRTIIEKFQFPVPTPTLSLLYFASFFCLMIISHNRVWELQELAITSFIFMVFLYNQFKDATDRI